MDFRPNIASFATGVYTVTRRGRTIVGNDSRADVAPAITFSTGPAAVQPMGGRELQRLPEGSRVAERKTLYTSIELKVTGAPDIVTINGEQWEVEVLEDWSQGRYYKYTIIKVGD